MKEPNVFDTAIAKLTKQAGESTDSDEAKEFAEAVVLLVRARQALFSSPPTTV